MNAPIKIYFILLLLTSCKNTYTANYDIKKKYKNDTNRDSIETSDTAFVNLKDYSNNFVFDMKYATNKNFLNSNVYQCEKCFLRLKTVKSLINANKQALQLGYKIKIFDCYRPLDVQKKMWAILPNATYVANPSKGSVHNRGGAVDVTLVDINNKELDMGTEFDYFGEKSSHSFINLSENIIKNRKLLKQVMKNATFEPLNSEWWHYNLINSKQDKVSNTKWECD